MLTFDPDETYWDCVCLLLPGGQATLVDTDTFERYSGSRWRLLGDSVYRIVRYEIVSNPTARPRNRKVRVRYRLESLHRLVLHVPYDRQGDHINRIRLDNRRSNLRVATASQNGMNRKGVANKTSRFKGVHWNKGQKRWIARVTFEGNDYHLGSFADETEAALAYNAFIKAHCLEFGYLNPVSAATAGDEPTTAKVPPKKRKSKLVKLTPKERKIKALQTKLDRMTRTVERRKQKRAELLAERKPWQPGDPTWPPAFTLRAR